ncbi:unnamed protein product [Schistosoma curassoni]|uniref:ThiF domain-containing protein n=1 Tax=Schistosoma curassoni TaxID=6186 RepID=A0A183KBB0_9TREM|nr:unnamed protein product [Schistosoma curassoni]
MVVGGEQETLGLGCVLLGTHQQGVPVILRELMLPDRSDPVSSNFRVRDFTTALYGPTAIDQSLIDICTSCADCFDNALNHHRKLESTALAFRSSVGFLINKHTLTDPGRSALRLIA